MIVDIKEQLMTENTNLPVWSELIDQGSDWYWSSNVLLETGSKIEGKNKNNTKTSAARLADFFVRNLYGRQNHCRSVKIAIAKALQALPVEKFGLNFGSGGKRYLPNVLNLDLSSGENIDIISAGTLKLPFKSFSLHLIICQEVLEHVEYPHNVIAEFRRTLHPDGALILQLPWVIGYHPGPSDYWRFSTTAYAILLPPNQWEITKKEVTVGHGSGMHRIATEFVAVHFSIFGNLFYKLAKGFSALVLSPLIFFDIVTPYLPEKDRISGGYIVCARPIRK
jgi:SAM-dependent methyltransferase